MPGPGGHHGGGPGMGHGGFGGGPGGPGGHGGPGGPGPGGFFRPRRRPPMMGGGWGMPPRPYRGGCCGCMFPILGAVIALITAAGFLLF